MIATRRHTPWLLGRMLAVTLALGAFGAFGVPALGHAHTPLVRTILVGHLPDALALDVSADRAFVANDGDATVSVLDLTTTRVLRTVAVGDPSARAPLTLALDARTHRLFVANRGDNGLPSVVRLLDSRSGAVLATVRVGPQAGALAVDARAGRALVATEGDGTVGLLDARSGAVLRTTRVGLAPLALAVDPDRARAFVLGAALLPSHEMVAGQAGIVSIVDTRTGALVATEGDGTVGLLDARSGAVLRTTRVGLAPLALAVDPDRARAFVIHTDGAPWEYGGTGGRVSVLDSRTGAVVRSVAVGHKPGAIAVDARTARVFVANSGDDTVSVLDARTGRALRTVAVGLVPATLAVDERAGRVFVADEGDGTLSVLDARTGTLLGTVTVFPEMTTLPLPYDLAVDEGRDRVYMTEWGRLDRIGLPLGNGRLAVLDARTGRLLRTLAVGVAPEAVAPEAGSGRVVVVSSGGMVHAPQSLAERWVRQMAGWVPWLGRLIPRAPDVVQVPGSVEVIDPGA